MEKIVLLQLHNHLKNTCNIAFIALMLFTHTALSQQSAITNFETIKPLIYNNTETALEEIVSSKPHSDNKHQTTWYWLSKAEAEGLLLLFDDMHNSLNQVSHLTDSPSNKASAQYHLLKGYLWQNKGALKQSEQQLAKAIAIAKEISEKRIELHASVDLAYTYTLQDLFEEALKTNHNAHQQAKELGDTFIVAFAEDVYGALYGYMDEYEQSIKHYQSALKGYQQLGYKQYMSSAIFGIATSNRYWGNLDQAIKYFKKYEEVLSYKHHEGSKFLGRYGMATTLHEKGDCQKALPALATALATQGPADYKAELYKRQAKCFISTQSISEAHDALNHAEDIFNQLPDLKGTTWDIETLYIKSKIKKAEGNYLESLQLLTEFHNKQATLAEKTYSKQLIATKSNLENQQKDLEIQLLTKNAKVQQLIADNQLRKNQQQQHILTFLSAAIVLIFLFAISQYRSAKKIAALSIKDDLTGIYNRRHTFDKLNEFLSSNSEESQLSIIVADIDNFKHINDSYGHPAGDSIIKKIAQTSEDTLRITDILGRIGGEEFLFILPRTTPEQCEEIAKRLLQVIRKKRFTLPSGQSIDVTISMGICHNTGGNTDAKSLFQKADEALYKSKNSGKNTLSTCLS